MPVVIEDFSLKRNKQ